MTPNMPTSGIEVDVYEATKSPAVAHVAQRMMIFEPIPSQIAMNETVIVPEQSQDHLSQQQELGACGSICRLRQMAGANQRAGSARNAAAAAGAENRPIRRISSKSIFP